MNPEQNEPGAQEPLVNVKQLKKYVIYPLLAVFGLWFCYLWLAPAFHGLSVNRARNQEIAPLLKQAKAAGLTYEWVFKNPAGAEGKPVIWCVQNRGELDVTVDGDANKRLTVSNYPRMPKFSGSKHEACTPMLLVLEKAAPGRPVPVFFPAY